VAREHPTGSASRRAARALASKFAQAYRHVVQREQDLQTLTIWTHGIGLLPARGRAWWST